MLRYALCILMSALGLCAGTMRADELPLPEVPQSLTVPRERADYIMGHFWDRLEAADTLRRRSREFMERNMVNFMSLFPHGTDAGRSRGIAALLAGSAGDTESLRVATEIFDRYLDSPGSPMHDETHYITCLEELLRLPALPEDVRARESYRLATAMKNRPGTVAADFAYTDRDGSRRTLHTTAPGEPLLLVFYDPECDRCNRLLQQLRESDIPVLAVYTEGDRKVWDDTKWSLPQHWTVGMDADGIVDSELYRLSELPVMYLLSPDKTVLEKEMPSGQ